MKGYAIKVDGVFLDLFPDQEVTFTEENPSTNNDLFIPNTSSFNINFPPTSINLQKLGNHTDLQQFDLKDSAPAELYLFGEWYCIGMIVIQGLENGYINTQFLEYDFKEEFSDAKLADIDMDKFDIYVDPEVDDAPLPAFFSQVNFRNDNYSANFPEKDFVTPTIFNPSATGIAEYDLINNTGDPEPTKVSTVFQNLYLGAWDKNVWDYIPGYYSPPIIPFSPLVFVPWLMKKSLNHIGFNVTDNMLESTEFHNLIIYTNRALILWNKKGLTWTDDLQNEPTITTRSTRPYEDELALANYMPNISILNFLKYICNTFNLYIQPSRNKKDVKILNRGVQIVNREKLDISSNTIFPAKYAYNKNQVLSKINWSNSDNNSEIEFNYKGRISTKSSLPTSPEDGDAYFVTDENRLYFYIKTANQFVAQEYNNKKYFNYSNLSKSTALKLDTNPAGLNKINEFSFIYRTGSGSINGVYSTNIDAPEIVESLSTASSAYNEEASNTENIDNIILLLYRGMVNSGDGYSYPFANAGSNYPYGSIPNAGFSSSLNMFGEGGIYETFWKNWIDQYTAIREGTIDLQPNSSIYKQLFANKLKIGNQLFLAKKKTIKVTPNSIVSCQVEIIQIKP